MSRRDVRKQIALGLAMLLAAAGCASGKQDKIPDRAELVSERSGRAGFVATDDGTLLIHDRNQGKTILTQPVRFRDKVLLYPDRGEVYYNGQLVHKSSLNPDHTYGLYFLKGIGSKPPAEPK